MTKRITVLDLQHMREHGQPLTVLTAYDYPTAKIADAAGIPVVDGAGNQLSDIIEFNTLAGNTNGEIYVAGSLNQLITHVIPHRPTEAQKAHAAQNCASATSCVVRSFPFPFSYC